MQQPKTQVRSAIDPVAKKQIVNKLRMSNAIVRYIQDINLVVPSVGIVGVGNIGHSIGKNPQPVNVKFTGKNTFDG